jgi:hypothetical protein|nr:MAG TPA: hypothetical protein [Caudoviricetes sp.]
MKFEIKSGIRGTSKDIILERLLFTAKDVDRIKEKYFNLNQYYFLESVSHYPYYQTTLYKLTPMVNLPWLNKLLSKVTSKKDFSKDHVKQSTLGHTPLQRDLIYYSEKSFLENLNFLNILDDLRASMDVVERIGGKGYTDVYKDTIDQFRLELFLYGLTLKGEYKLEKPDNNKYRLFDLLGLDSSDIRTLIGDKDKRDLKLKFTSIEDNIANVHFKVGDQTYSVDMVFNVENSYEKNLLETLNDKFVFRHDKYLSIHTNYRKYYLGTKYPSEYLSFIKKDNVLYVKTVTEDSILTHSFRLGEFRIESTGHKGIFPITKIIPTVNPEEAIELYCDPSEIPL